MNPTVLHQRAKVLFIQRNSLGLIASFLLVSNLCLCVIAINRQEKTVVVPATLAREVIIEDGGYFSVEYLEEMTLFFSSLLLDLTPDNIAYKSSVLLKHVHPTHYHELKSYFKNEEERYKKYGLITHFDLSSIKILKMSAEITGVLYSQFGAGDEKHDQSTFEIEYTRSNGVLQIKAFKVKVSDD